MKYITIEDLTSVIQDVMLQSSVEKDYAILDTIESSVLDEVASYIGARYQVELIFAETPMKHGLLQRIVATLTVYRAIRRNAARKVPADIVSLEEWAYEMLGKVSNGILPLPGLPLVTDNQGNAPSLWGSTKKSEYYI